MIADALEEPEIAQVVSRHLERIPEGYLAGVLAKALGHLVGQAIDNVGNNASRIKRPAQADPRGRIGHPNAGRVVADGNGQG